MRSQYRAALYSYKIDGFGVVRVFDNAVCYLLM